MIFLHMHLLVYFYREKKRFYIIFLFNMRSLLDVVQVQLLFFQVLHVQANALHKSYVITMEIYFIMETCDHMEKCLYVF